MRTQEFRDTAKSRIMQLFESKSWMLGIWEGGSAATGFLDDYSDLDLGFVVKDEFVEETFQLFEELLTKNYGIKSRLRIPEPTWHGHSQCYYFVEKCPPLFYIDIVVEKESAGDRLIEPDRHGTSQIWLNKNDVLKPLPTPVEEMEKKNRMFFRRQLESYPIFTTEVKKQILRGNRIDAMLEYQSFILRKLSALLNLKYRPAKFDFGIRYGDREYPPEVAEKVTGLFYAGTFEELSVKFEEALAWADELIDELREKLIS